MILESGAKARSSQKRKGSKGLPGVQRSIKGLRDEVSTKLKISKSKRAGGMTAAVCMKNLDGALTVGLTQPDVTRKTNKMETMITGRLDQTTMNLNGLRSKVLPNMTS